MVDVAEGKNYDLLELDTNDVVVKTIGKHCFSTTEQSVESIDCDNGEALLPLRLGSDHLP